MNKKTVLLVGGGTGGHIVPVFEVYNKLRENREIEVVVVGSGNELEQKFFKNNKDFKKIIVGKINRRLTFSNIIEFTKTFVGLFQALALLIFNRPRLIFSKGGYVSFPLIFWAKILCIPYFIHESDIEMGLSNRYALGLAKKAFVSFPEKYYPKKNNIVYSGHIIQDRLLSRNDKKYETFEFDKRSTILVLGGSQGSKTINDNIIALLPKLLLRYNIIHQTGALDYNRVQRIKSQLESGLGKRYFVNDFLFNDIMIDAVNLADVVVARAGGTIAELGMKGKAMVLLPYSHAASNHQSKNADYLVSHRAAIIMKDEVDPDLLENLIAKAISERKELELNVVKLFKANGLNFVVATILKEVEA